MEVLGLDDVLDKKRRTMRRREVDNWGNIRSISACLR